MKRFLAIFIVLTIIPVVSVAAKKQNSLCRTSMEKFRNAHPEAFMIKDDVTAPVLVFKKEVEFPESIKNKKQAWGIIIAETVVSDRGSIADVCIIRSEHSELDAFVLDAVKKWKYEPALKNGKPVPVFITITVRIEVR